VRHAAEGAEHRESSTSSDRDDLPLATKLADLAMMSIFVSMQGGVTRGSAGKEARYSGSF
jgi:hypothetical protein